MIAAAVVATRAAGARRRAHVSLAALGRVRAVRARGARAAREATIGVVACHELITATVVRVAFVDVDAT